MGSPAAPIGASSVFGAQLTALGQLNGPDRKNDPRGKGAKAVASDGASANAPADTPRSAGQAAQNSDAGVYQIADAVVFQLQLESITFSGDTGQGAATPTTAATGPQTAAASQAATANAGTDAAAQVTAATQTATGAAGTSAAAQTVAAPQTAAANATTQTTIVPQNATGGAAAGNAAAQGVAGSASTGSSSSLQSQEVQLQTALQALGLSPSQVQQFMTVARLLAQLDPNVFQNFVTQIVYLAKSERGAQPSQTSQNAAALTSGAPASSGNSAGAAPGIEVTSVEVAQVEVQVTAGQGNGGTSVSVTAEAEAASIQQLAFLPQQTPPAAQNALAPNSATPPGTSAPAANT